MLLAIVYGAVFLTVLGALSGYVLTQNRAQTNATIRAQATAIAEAGLEYYRWSLAHFPSDLQNGTELPGPYTIAYQDPEGGQVGTIELAVTGNMVCGAITSIDIRSTGRTLAEPTLEQTLTARYARPSVARYSYILNDSVWAGADRVINGPYHSNGGVRMDGTANSTVTSSLSSWLCTSSFGCVSNQTQPGVFGTGSNQTLWEYPVPQVDFAAIAADFGGLKTKAQEQGQYLPRVSTGTNKQSASYWNGYHLIFNGNNTVTVRRVTDTTELPSTAVNTTDEQEGVPDRTLIKTELFYSTITLPSDCALIYVEDNVWIEGIVDQKVTIVAANVMNTGVDPSAVLVGNVTYAATDGSDGLTLIAENNILIAPNSPQNMNLRGIFVAQGGAFGRNYYWRSSNDSRCHTTYEPRGSLTIQGTTVSNLRTGTKWMNTNCGSDNEAGYDSRTDSYDRILATDPPPFTPYLSADYVFVDWQEE